LLVWEGREKAYKQPFSRPRTRVLVSYWFAGLVLTVSLYGRANGNQVSVRSLYTPNFRLADYSACILRP
jgi:hypothetical protein